MDNKIAITREVSSSLANCELTHLERNSIDVDLARKQHHQYEACLIELSCTLVRLPAEPDLPDAVFVEDTAVVLEEFAVITRPGADSRKPETASVADALTSYRKLQAIQEPGTLDGGDVLRLGREIYVGESLRSNRAGITQLRHMAEPYGYTVRSVKITNCLHLKSAVTQIHEDTLLINPLWVDQRTFGGWKFIEVDLSEPYAANALLIGETVIYPTSYPHTRQRLEDHGLSLKMVDVSELIKAEGAVTCCSLVFNV